MRAMLLDCCSSENLGLHPEPLNCNFQRIPYQNAGVSAGVSILLEYTRVHLKFGWSILQVYFNNKIVKEEGTYLLQVYVKGSIFEVCFLYIFPTVEVYLKHTSSIFQVYFNYA